jgi:hypothetical protein
MIIIPNLFNETQIKGLTTELQCIEKFIQYGFIVSIPYGNNSRYDLLLDGGNGHYIRIQCKTAHLEENGSYTIKTANSVATINKNIIKHYNNKQIDFIVSIIDNQLVVIPVDLISNTNSKIFRKELPQYGAKSNCNLIKDFTVEKYILPMLTE